MLFPCKLELGDPREGSLTASSCESHSVLSNSSPKRSFNFFLLLLAWCVVQGIMIRVAVKLEAVGWWWNPAVRLWREWAGSGVFCCLLETLSSHAVPNGEVIEKYTEGKRRPNVNVYEISTLSPWILL